MRLKCRAPEAAANAYHNPAKNDPSSIRERPQYMYISIRSYLSTYLSAHIYVYINVVYTYLKGRKKALNRTRK